jgi:hypothetical protein
MNMTVVLLAVMAVFVVLYMLKRRSRLTSDEY